MKHGTRSGHRHGSSGDTTIGSSITSSSSSIYKSSPPKSRKNKKHRERSSSSLSPRSSSSTTTKAKRSRLSGHMTHGNKHPFDEHEEKFDLHHHYRQRSVCFSPEVRIRRIPNRMDLTDGDCRSMYMNRRDFDRIEEEIEDLILQTKKDRRLMAKYMEEAGYDSNEEEESKNDDCYIMRTSYVNEDSDEEVEVVGCIDSSSSSNNSNSHGSDIDESNENYAFGDEFSMRGLEMWISSKRQKTVESIIRETLRYQSFGLPDVMAAVYRNCATPSAHAAYMTALIDEQQARDYCIRSTFNDQ